MDRFWNKCWPGQRAQTFPGTWLQNVSNRHRSSYEPPATAGGSVSHVVGWCCLSLCSQGVCMVHQCTVMSFLVIHPVPYINNINCVRFKPSNEADSTAGEKRSWVYYVSCPQSSIIKKAKRPFCSKKVLGRRDLLLAYSAAFAHSLFSLFAFCAKELSSCVEPATLLYFCISVGESSVL